MILKFCNKLEHTLTFSALLSISDVHFLMMKGMPSGTFLAAWANSTPNKWSLPWSFLCPHWIAKVSKHFLWHASEHYRGGKKVHGLIQSDTIKNISAVCHPICEENERFISLLCFCFEFMMILWATKSVLFIPKNNASFQNSRFT